MVSLLKAICPNTQSLNKYEEENLLKEIFWEERWYKLEWFLIKLESMLEFFLSNENLGYSIVVHIIAVAIDVTNYDGLLLNWVC